MLAVFHVQFLVQAADMELDGAWSHFEMPGDAFVGKAGVDGVEYLPLPRGERGVT